MDDEAFCVLKELSLDNVSVISLDDLVAEDLREIRVTRPHGEFCWTCTPFLVDYCLKKFNLNICTYLDADIYFFESPQVLLDELGDDDVLITEHRYSPEYDQTEVSGRFCVQFLSFKNNQNAFNVLDSWKKDCISACELNPEKGLCGDQKYLDKWPSTFNGIKILENNGANGPWNINSFFYSNSVIFYHFHGLKFYLNLDYELTGSKYFISKKVFQEIYRPYIVELFSLQNDLYLKFQDDFIGHNIGLSQRKKIKEFIKKKVFKNYNFLRNVIRDFEVLNCPVCESSSIKIAKQNLYDDRFGFPGFYSYLDCNECRHTFLYHHHNENKLIDLYSNFYPRSKFKLDQVKANTFKPGLKSWLRGERASVFTWVPEKSKVLDVGCGFGESLLYHKNRNCEAYGVEADENILRVGEKFGLNVKSEILSANTFAGEKFKYITLDQVVEHSLRPDSILKLLSDYLDADGYIIMSFPNYSSIWRKIFSRYWLHWHIPYHTQLYSDKSLGIVLSQSNLYIDSIVTITNSDWLLFQILHLVNFPPNNTKSKVWNLGLDQGWKKYLNIVFKILHRFYMSHILMRIIDNFQLGDNKVCIIKKKSLSN